MIRVNNSVELIAILVFAAIFIYFLYLAIVAIDYYLHVIMFENSRRALTPYGPDAYVAAVIMRRGIRWFIKAWVKSKRTIGSSSRFGTANRPPALLLDGIMTPVVISLAVYFAFSFGWYVVDFIAGSDVSFGNYDPAIDIFIFTFGWVTLGSTGYLIYVAHPRGLPFFRHLPGFHREEEKVRWRARLTSMQMSYHRLFLHWLTPMYVAGLALFFVVKVEIFDVRLGEFYPWGMFGAFGVAKVAALTRRRQFLKVNVIRSLEDLLYILDSRKSDNPDPRYWIYFPVTRNEAIESLIFSIEKMVRKSPFSYISGIPNPGFVLFHGVARRMRKHLSGLSSLEAELPQIEEQILRLTYISVIDPNEAKARDELNELIECFDENGYPLDEIAYPSRSRFSGRIESVSRLLDFGDRIYQSSRPLIVAAIVVVLFAFGYINKETIIQMIGIQ
jgi:hypothetical protein